MKSYRIALAQINPSVGDLKNNTKKIIKLINEFKEKADLLVFPELCLVGYPPEDLILRKALLEKVLPESPSLVKILTPLPNSWSLTKFNASLKFFALTTDRTGPKISSL